MSSDLLLINKCFHLFRPESIEVSDLLTYLPLEIYPNIILPQQLAHYIRILSGFQKHFKHWNGLIRSKQQRSCTK